MLVAILVVNLVCLAVLLAAPKPPVRRRTVGYCSDPSPFEMPDMEEQP